VEKDPAHELSLPYYGFETVDLSIRHATSSTATAPLA